MGLIAGLILKNNDGNITEKLYKMIQVQSHRDNSKITKIANERYAIGMSNRHNEIWCKNKLDTKSNKTVFPPHIHAFIDGIVLDVPIIEKKLRSRGISISHPTCSYIIAAAYEIWGIDFLNYLDGEFSCVIWDANNYKLILARDPYGSKPMHYYYSNGEFYFSSEAKGIISLNLPISVNLTSLNDFLSLGRVPYPATFFKNIYQVPPGSMIIFSEDNIEEHVYHDNKISVDTSLSFDDAIENFEEKIRNAVHRRIITNKTFSFLSGGIDSSTVVSFAAELSNKPVGAICASFKEDKFDERKYAKVMAEHVGADLELIIVTSQNFLNMFDKMVWHHDMPFYDTSAYPTYFASKGARSYTDIILTGDGVDQILAGDELLYNINTIKSLSKKSEPIKLLYKLGENVIGKFIKNPTPNILTKIYRKLYRDSYAYRPIGTGPLFDDFVKKYLCTDDFIEIVANQNPNRHIDSWFNEVKLLDDINKFVAGAVRFFLMDGLMIKVDRMCRSNGLETMSPFLDKELCALANRMPGSFKINFSKNSKPTVKYILQKICEARLPRVLLERKKQGFAIPLKQWLMHDKGKFISEMLLDKRTIQRGYFKKESLENYVNTFINNKGDWFYPSTFGIVSLITLEIWHRIYVDGQCH